MSTDNTIWGIDLGTTYSCISRVDNHGYPVVINNLDGEPITPSVVLFAGPDEVIVGRAAKDELLLNPDQVCELVKQKMGDESWRFRAHDKDWSAPQVSSFVLQELARSAEQASGIPVKDVVITVPAYFGVTEREATVAAGKLAELNVIDIINEPTAAAFSYGFANDGESEETVLVYDLGGGTFDVTVIRLEATESGGSAIRVLATSGDDRLGGALWDQRLAELLAQKFVEANPGAVDPLDDPQASADLRLKAEAIKRSLTSKEEHSEMVLAGTDRAKVTVTRAEFETATAELLERTLDYTKEAVKTAEGAGATSIDRVLLVGGSSFMPQVTRALTDAFPEWTPELSDPNQAVAKGAALAGLTEELRRQIIGDSSDNGAGPLPAPSAETIREIAEATSLSASTVERLVKTEFTNVCSRGFGVRLLREDADLSDLRPWREHQEDFFVLHIIAPNTPLPVTGLEDGRVQTVYTVADNQSRLELTIMEQDSREPAQDMSSNKFLQEGEFVMTRAYPRGTPIDIALGMDNSGKLTLQATDPDGKPFMFDAEATGAVWSEERLEESAGQVNTMRLGG